MKSFPLSLRLKYLTAVTCFFSLVSAGHSQEKLTLVMLAPQVGDTIDFAEKAKYHLFPFFSAADYKYAQCFQKPDGSYLVRETLIDNSIKDQPLSMDEILYCRKAISNYSVQKISSPDQPANRNSYFYFTYICGYGFGLPSENIETESTQLNSSCFFELKKGSFGQGFTVGGNIGGMFGRNIGAEIGCNYLIGYKYKFKYIDQALTVFDTIGGKMLRIFPELVISSGGNKFSLYSKLGIIFSFANSLTVRETDIGTGNSQSTLILFNKGISIGYRSSLGANIKLSDFFDLFTKICLVNQRYSPLKGTVKEYNVNGVDRLYTLNTSQKETDYVNNLTITSNNNTSTQIAYSPNSNLPTQELKRSFPFSSLGINVGIKIKL